MAVKVVKESILSYQLEKSLAWQKANATLHIIMPPPLG